MIEKRPFFPTPIGEIYYSTQTGISDYKQTGTDEGITIRQYAAIEVLKGLISNNALIRDALQKYREDMNEVDDLLCEHATLLADKLLSQLGKG